MSLLILKKSNPSDAQTCPPIADSFPNWWSFGSSLIFRQCFKVSQSFLHLSQALFLLLLHFWFIHDFGALSNDSSKFFIHCFCFLKIFDGGTGFLSLMLLTKSAYLFVIVVRVVVGLSRQCNNRKTPNCLLNLHVDQSILQFACVDLFLTFC